jgi:hypothetical protein
MTSSLNYSVPIQNFQPTINQNGQIVSILPRSSFPKLIIGINSVFNMIAVASDFIDLTHRNQWGNFQNDLILYMETINPTAAVWRDYGMFIAPPVFMFANTLAVPMNTQVVAHYANLKPSVIPKLLTTFYVVRSVV